jgi:hypothetical protein
MSIAHVVNDARSNPTFSDILFSQMMKEFITLLAFLFALLPHESISAPHVGFSAELFINFRFLFSDTWGRHLLMIFLALTLTSFACWTFCRSQMHAWQVALIVERFVLIQNVHQLNVSSVFEFLRNVIHLHHQLVSTNIVCKTASLSIQIALCV